MNPVDEFYERTGFTYDVPALRWLHNGVPCNGPDRYLRPEYNDIILRDPYFGSKLPRAVDRLSLSGFHTLKGIVIRGSVIEIVYIDNLDYKACIEFNRDNLSIRCSYYIAFDELAPYEWTLTQMRLVYHKILFKRLPQPIAEEIAAEFIMG